MSDIDLEAIKAAVLRNGATVPGCRDSCPDCQRDSPCDEHNVAYEVPALVAEVERLRGEVARLASRPEVGFKRRSTS